MKSTVLDTGNWLKCLSLLRLLEPLTTLSTLMSKDQGDALPFFYIGMHCIEKNYDSKPYRDRRKGFGGVSYTFAQKARNHLQLKWLDHYHVLDAAAALLQPLTPQ